jgi:hypothetical protein
MDGKYVFINALVYGGSIYAMIRWGFDSFVASRTEMLTLTN